MNYVYIIECKNGELYTGWTTDLEKRIETHNKGKGAKYTRGRTPVVLRYYETFDVKEEALERERTIKKMPRGKKIKLFQGI